MGVLARQGILGKDDNDDGVSGIVQLLRGKNPSKVLEGIHRRVAELNTKLLPPDVKVVPYLDRTELVNTTLHTVSRTLLEGMALVVIVLILFLGSVRGAALVALTIPFSLLWAFVLMRYTNIPANLLSLGAIDFGIIVDGAIVLLEVILRRHERNSGQPLTESNALDATLEVAKPMFFATLVIITAATCRSLPSSESRRSYSRPWHSPSVIHCWARSCLPNAPFPHWLFSPTVNRARPGTTRSSNGCGCVMTHCCCELSPDPVSLCSPGLPPDWLP